jgi:hypothetical protein
MNYRNYSLSLILLICIISFPETAKACSGGFVPACVAYDYANAVFIGKLIKIEENEELSSKRAHFEVKKVFKGMVGQEEIVEFQISDCAPIFNVGEIYFVYKNHVKGQVQNQPFFDRTARFSNKSADFIYASGLSKEKSIFTISGRVEFLSESEQKKVKVLIENGENSYESSIDKYGQFNQKVMKKGIYNVKIMLPFKTDVLVMTGNSGYDVETIKDKNQTIVSYQVEPQNNSCDWREIKWSKDY